MLSKLSSRLMNKKNILAITAILGLCSSNLVFVNAASAQVSWETQQELNEIDALLEKSSRFIQHTEQLRQQQMNALYSACNSGNSNACLQYEIRTKIEDRAIENHIQRLRDRNRR